MKDLFQSDINPSVFAGGFVKKTGAFTAHCSACNKDLTFTQMALVAHARGRPHKENVAALRKKSADLAATPVEQAAAA